VKTNVGKISDANLTPSPNFFSLLKSFLLYILPISMSKDAGQTIFLRTKKGYLYYI